MHRKALAAVAFFVLTAPMFGSVVYRYQNRDWQILGLAPQYYIQVAAPDFIQSSETFALDTADCSWACTGSTLTLAQLANPLPAPAPLDEFVRMTLTLADGSSSYVDFNGGIRLNEQGIWFWGAPPTTLGSVLFIGGAPLPPNDPPAPVPEPSSLALVALPVFAFLLRRVRTRRHTGSDAGLYPNF